ncbi:MAG: ABC transporter ATP-binding protein [Anaeroplasma sp.]
MIEFKNLSFKIDNNKILDNVSFQTIDNAINVIIGENGSGKTTLFNSMLSLYKDKYDGDILIDNVSIKEISNKDLSKKISYNFQVKPNSDLLIDELLCLGRSPYKGIFFKLSESEKKGIESIKEICGVSHLSNRRLNTLSGGERQMVYLALSLVQNSKYYLFDEPDTYLDKKNFNKTIDIIKKLKQNGHTIIMSLHSLSDAFEIADRIIVINKGNIEGIIEKEDFFTENLVEKIFDLKKIVTYIDNKKMILFK